MKGYSYFFFTIINMVDRLVNSEANRKRIEQVELCFGGSGQPLAVSGRVLVGEGVLTKNCRKRCKPRQFFLFNDALVYGNIVLSKKKYNKQHVLPLQDVQLKSVDDEGNLKNGWQIISATKSFTVYAATATEKSEWMAHINKCISDLLAKSGKKPAKQLSPVWVPDHDAPHCMLCNKRFTTLFRRHHCRKCGKVVCQSCSAKKFLLPLQSEAPVRVCDYCYQQLSLEKNGTRERMGETRNAAPLDQDSDDDDDDDEDTDGITRNTQAEDVHPTFYEENYR